MQPKIMSERDARAYLGGIGRTKFFALASEGRLQKIRIDGRTFVTVASARKLIRDSKVNAK